mmetsp:Transcript_8276/g.29058  ORF Transcript_8276/g.29058 Transcript_8276/m.29058 type:complete len:321 (+) Transcript_8276:1972-2934(+)
MGKTRPRASGGSISCVRLARLCWGAAPPNPLPPSSRSELSSRSGLRDEKLERFWGDRLTAASPLPDAPGAPSSARPATLELRDRPPSVLDRGLEPPSLLAGLEARPPPWESPDLAHTIQQRARCSSTISCTLSARKRRNATCMLRWNSSFASGSPPLHGVHLRFTSTTTYMLLLLQSSLTWSSMTTGSPTTRSVCVTAAPSARRRLVMPFPISSPLATPSGSSVPSTKSETMARSPGCTASRAVIPTYSLALQPTCDSVPSPAYTHRKHSSKPRMLISPSSHKLTFFSIFVRRSSSRTSHTPGEDESHAAPSSSTTRPLR